MSKIIFIGDSITKGTDYGGVTAADTFAAKIGAANGFTNCINAGVASDTSAGVLARLSVDVIQKAPAVCVVMIGINDWSTGVTVSAYRANIESIFSGLAAAGIRTVGITSSMQRGSTAEFAAFQPYVQAFEAEARAKRVPVVDLYRGMATSYLYLSSTDFAALYVDTVHLTVKGHDFVAALAGRPSFAGVFS